MATFKKLIIGGSGSGSAKIAPIVINDVGTYDATSPHIVTEKWTENDIFDIQFDLLGTPVSCAKAKKISNPFATNALYNLTFSEHSTISCNGTMNGEAIEFTASLKDLSDHVSTSCVSMVTALNEVPFVLWIYDAAEFSNSLNLTENPFEDNTVYICDIFTLANATGELSITAPGIDEVDAFLPVTVDFDIRDLEVTPSNMEQGYHAGDGVFYENVIVKKTPLQEFTVTAGDEEKTIRPESGYIGFSSVTVKPISESKILIGIYIDTLPKTIYKKGEWLDTNNGVLMRYYSDGSTSPIALINNYVYGWSDVYYDGEFGEHVLTVKYVENDVIHHTRYTIRLVEDLEVTEPGTYDTTNNTSVTVNIPEYDGTIEEIS